MFRLDNNYFNAEYVAKDGYSQTADILNGENSGRLQGNGSMFLDYLGTFFNSEIKLRRGQNCTDEEWNNFFIALCNPINKHNIDIPFGNGFLTLDIYISKVSRSRIKETIGRVSVWEKVYSFTATAIDSNWLAGDILKGLSG